MRPWSRASDKDPLRTAFLNAVLATVYFAAAKMGLALAVVHASASAVWPPTGIALAAFLLFGNRIWLGVAVGAFLANVTTAGTITTSLGIALGNTLEGFVGAWLVRRYAGGRETLRRSVDIFRFALLAAGVSTLVSATIGVTTLSLAGFAPWADFGSIWTTWWLGDAMGALVVAPALLLWGTGGPIHRPRRPFEATCAVFFFLATAIVFFSGVGTRNAPVEWFWLPAVVWISYGFGQRAAATMVLALSGLTLWGTINGLGPFVLPSANVSLLLLQAFLGVVSVIALVLSAVVTARARLLEDLARGRDHLEIRVTERTADLSRANAALSNEILERTRLERELLDAGERERQRLGRDLHDDLGQLLTGIGFLSSAAEQKLAAQSRPEARALLDIRGLVQEAIAKTRILSLGLTPVTLGEGGFVGALRELAVVTERVFKVPCALEYAEFLEVDDALAATNLYRIAQEAVSNAVRHGSARHIVISLAMDGDTLRLSVRDDGRGFDGNHGTHEGLGLGIMRYRAELVGGMLEVESKAQGTTVACVAPGVARRSSEAESAGPPARGAAGARSTLPNRP
jgi:signal transduction histidine kinase